MELISEIKTNDSITKTQRLPIYADKIIFSKYYNWDGYINILDHYESIGYNVEEVKNETWFKTFGYVVNIDGVLAICINQSGGIYNDELMLIDTLAHETYHIVQELSKFHFLTMTNKNNNEHIAYLIGYINKELYRFIKSL